MRADKLLKCKMLFFLTFLIPSCVAIEILMVKSENYTSWQRANPEAIFLHIP